MEAAIRDRSMKSPDLFIMDEAGRPIFSTIVDQAEAARLAGLIQATRGTIMNHPALKGLGDLQQVRFGQRSITTRSFESITLSAISISNDTQEILSKRFLAFIHAKLIFTLTSQIHLLVRQGSSIDIDGILVRNRARARNYLEASHFSNRPSPHHRPITLVMTGIQIFCPIAPGIRHCVSLALKHVAEKTPNTVFGLLLVGQELVSIVQVSHLYGQVRSALELDLLAACIEEQHLGTGDVWFPICLPCISADGFLHCFAHEIDSVSRLTLALVSEDNSVAQFQRFRSAATDIRKQLGICLPSVDDVPDVEDEDYELVSYSPSSEVSLLEALHTSKTDKNTFVQSLLGTDGLHFVARRMFGLKGTKQPRRKLGRSLPVTHLSQVISGGSDQGNCNIWEAYARLRLLMRNDETETEESSQASDDVFGLSWLETLPKENSLVYEEYAEYIIIGTCDVHLEAYLTMKRTRNIQQAIDAAKAILQGTMGEEERLFLTYPLTFEECRTS